MNIRNVNATKFTTARGGLFGKVNNRMQKIRQSDMARAIDAMRRLLTALDIEAQESEPDWNAMREHNKALDNQVGIVASIIAKGNGNAL